MKSTSMNVLAFFLGISVFSCPAFASDLIWYDQDKQAIAIDTYANGYGGIIEIDFNEDHSAAGLIDQTLTQDPYGSITQAALYETTIYSWGEITDYGWGQALGEFEPLYGYSDYLVNLNNGLPAPDGFHFFTPEWDVITGKTVIYVQPVISSEAIPVSEEILANTFIRVLEGEWVQLDDLVVDPEPEPLLVDVSIFPRVINIKSKKHCDKKSKKHHRNKRKGRWVMAKIELPAPYTADDVDLDTVYLTINSEFVTDDSNIESVELVRKVSRAGKFGNKLIAKFDKQQLMDLLAAGDNIVYARGSLLDGTPIQGTATLRVIDK